MPAAARVGDLAFIPGDAHGCPACAHPAIGPATDGSPDVLVNGLKVLRIGDPGIHSACCGANSWNSNQGSPTVFANGISVTRQGDASKHCGGSGSLVMGSPNVFVGDSYCGSYQPPPDALQLLQFLMSIASLFKGGLPSPNLPKPSMPSKPGKPSGSGKPQKPEKPSKPEKPGKPDMPEKPSKPDMPDKPEKPSKPEKPDMPDMPDKPEKPSKPEKPDMPDMPDKPEKPDMPDMPDKPEKPNKPSSPGKDGSEPPKYELQVDSLLAVLGKKDIFDTEASVKAGFSIKKELVKPTSMKELVSKSNKDNYLKFGNREAALEHGYKYDIQEGKHEFAVYNLSGKVSGVEAQYKNVKAGGLSESVLKGEAFSASGEFKPLDVVVGKDGFEAKSSAGVEANLVKGSAESKLNITPKTVYDNTLGKAVGAIEGLFREPKLNKLPDSWDHGIVVGGKVEAGIGAAAKAEAGVIANSQEVALKLSAKVGAGPMAGVGLILGVK